MRRSNQPPTPEELQALWEHCKGFIERYNISCGEAVYQSDRVILNAYEFITGVCEVVGYCPVEGDKV